MSDFHSIDTIHQVLIVDGGGLPETLPTALTDNKEWAKRFYPDAVYQLWSGDSVREFLRINFRPEVADAYDVLRPYSYRCDLARFACSTSLAGCISIWVCASWDAGTSRD